MADIIDPDLIPRALGGDHEAFAQIIRMFHEAIFRFCMALTGRVADAEDATEAAFLNVWKARRSIREPAKFKSFLFRVAHNAAMDVLRQRPPFDPLDAQDEDEARPPAQHKDPAPGPEALAERAQAHRNVLRALQQIAPEYRAAVVLRDMQGLSYEDVAGALNIPMGTVDSRIARGRQELARLLKQKSGNRP